MRTLTDEFFDEEELGTKTLNSLDVPKSWDKSTNPKDWSYVYARSQTRDAPLYTDSYFRVLRSQNEDPLTDSVETMTVEEILERMPTKLKENYVVPSPSGGYLTMVEVRGKEMEDGTITIEKFGQPVTIPVELVYRQLTYDEIVVELLD